MLDFLQAPKEISVGVLFIILRSSKYSAPAFRRKSDAFRRSGLSSYNQ